MNKTSLVAIISAFILITGCTQHVQTTSGRAYLERYDHITPYTGREQEQSDQKSQGINQLIRQAAAVEPTLRFPARIGIARIDAGYLTSIPDTEVEAWEKSRQRLGQSFDNRFGEFIPVSPMIVSMVTASTNYEAHTGYDHRITNVMNEIRLGAARQHLDAVLIYEVYSRENSDSNLLSIGNLTIIGAYLLPSKAVTTEGFANAMLIDVIQGYPYGTAEASLDKSEMTTTFGRREKMEQLSDEIKSEVTIKLVAEVEDMFRDLQLELLRKKNES